MVYSVSQCTGRTFFNIACMYKLDATNIIFSRKVATSLLSHLKEAKKRSFLFSHFFSEPDFFILYGHHQITWKRG